VSLSCAGPDGRSVHSIVWSSSTLFPSGAYVIKTHFLPLGRRGDEADENEDGNSHGNTLMAVTTPLPSHITKSLEADPPLGMICVDRDDGGSNMRGPGGFASPLRRWGSDKSNATEGDGRVRSLPLLCLFSLRALYVLRAGYTCSESDCNASTPRREIEGQIITLAEPLETYLLSMPGATLRSVRPAPQSWHPPAGFGEGGSMNRPGAFAALVDESGGSGGGGEQALVLCHGFADGAENAGGNGDSCEANMAVTVPVRHGYEYLGPTESDPITDFCFFRAPTSLALGAEATAAAGSPGLGLGLSLFPSLSVLLLSRRGNLYAASPVVFNGSVYPRRSVADAARYLEGEAQRLVRDDPRWRMVRAARMFLDFAFGDAAVTVARGCGSDVGGGYYATACVAAAASGGAFDGSPTEPTEDATTWPVTMQGPLLTLHGAAATSEGEAGENFNDADQLQTEGDYVVLENFPGSHSGPLGGIVAVRCSDAGAVASASSSTSLAFAVLPSGPFILPRFAFESPEDADALDGAAGGLGMVVERVDLLDDGGEEDYGRSGGSNSDELGRVGLTLRGVGHKASKSVLLIPDSSDPTQVHVVTPYVVNTVRTDAVEVAAGIVTKDAEAIDKMNFTKGSFALVPTPVHVRSREPKTIAWSCIEVAAASMDGPGVGRGRVTGFGVFLMGAAVSQDATLGRVLIVTLSDGSVEAVDLTAAQYLHEASALATEEEEASSAGALVPAPASLGTKSADLDRAVRAMEALPPLHEVIAPLMKQVATGLAGMGKIVGAATKPSDIDAAGLASVLETKARCEGEVVLPLAELREASSARARLLEEMILSQKEQLDSLRGTALELRNRLDKSMEHCAAVRDGCEELSGRSTAVLGAARDLAPALTEAEREYAAQLRRYDAQFSKWEGGVERLEEEAARACDAMRPCDGEIVGGSTLSGVCRILLGADEADMCRNLLRGQEIKIKRARTKVNEMKGMVQEVRKGTGFHAADANKENGLMQ